MDIPKYNLPKLIVELRLSQLAGEHFDEWFQNDESFRKEVLEAIEKNIMAGSYTLYK